MAQDPNGSPLMIPFETCTAHAQVWQVRVLTADTKNLQSWKCTEGDDTGNDDEGISGRGNSSSKFCRTTPSLPASLLDRARTLPRTQTRTVVLTATPGATAPDMVGNRQERKYSS